jgi:hypothetical protein
MQKFRRIYHKQVKLIERNEVQDRSTRPLASISCQLAQSKIGNYL